MASLASILITPTRIMPEARKARHRPAYASRGDARALWTRMRELSLSCIEKKKLRKFIKKKKRLRVFGSHEPLKFGQRVVLRSQGRVQTDKLVEIHTMFKRNSIIATKLLNSPAYRKMCTEFRCAIRASFEEQMKVTAQLTGVFPPDQDLTRATQELFEQFYEDSLEPNEAECELLSIVSGVDEDAIDAWFAVKNFRLRALRHLKSELKKAVQKYSMHLQRLRGGFVIYKYNIQKPYCRH